ncbi:MAG TPA: lipopolysaccharide heptosyltransferase I [Pyrinomonadaceae bacterium]|nr:lipopolysaccharide heptosyltransferase I [Pyrinomonadaceae bacterium]
MTRILIVKLGSIGDIVHALPALGAMRRALPEAEISWVVERRAAEILRDNPFLNRLIEIDTKALRRWPVSGETLLAPRQQLRRLRASAFDSALDFQGLIKSAFIARLSGAPRRYGFSRAHLREPASRFLLTDTVETPARLHVIRKNLALAAGALGIDVPIEARDFAFPLAIRPEHETEAARLVERLGRPFAILNPGGGWPTKLWDAARFGALADALYERHGLASAVTYGPGEGELAERAAAASRTGAAIAVSPSLRGFYALARRASVYVGGDTGPTHLAVAADAPVVGLFGPTEWWRNGSPRAEDVCVERTDIGCRVDCHRRACAKWVCLDIEVERVASAVAERLVRASAEGRGGSVASAAEVRAGA